MWSVLHRGSEALVSSTARERLSCKLHNAGGNISCFFITKMRVQLLTVWIFNPHWAARHLAAVHQTEEGIVQFFDDTKTADAITISNFSIYGSLKSPLEHPLSKCCTSASARSHLSTLQPSTFERIMPLKSEKHQWCQKLLGSVFDKLTIQSDSRM